MALESAPGVGSKHPNRSAEHLTARDLSRVARSMYTTGPYLLRKLQHWRPYICPFERVVAHMLPGSSVLDIGCGSGLLLSLAAGLGIEFEGVGFDVSRQGIELATRMMGRAAHIAPSAKLLFHRLDIHEPWPQGVFDIVCIVDVMHHVPPRSQQPFLKQAVSKVKRGGTLIYKDMCLRPWWMAQANRVQDLVIARQWINYVPIETVEDWASSYGMRVKHREDLSRLWCGHELRVMVKDGGNSSSAA